MKISTSCFVIFLFLTACVKEIPFNEKNMTPKLVVNSIITPDSTIKVQVSKTIPITSNEPREVLNATVTLYEDGNNIGTLANNNNGFYTIGKYPAVGKLYELKVDAYGFSSTSAKEIIPPDTAKIIECSYRGPIGYDPANQYDYSEVNVKFNDNGNEKNYYEIIFYKLYNNEKYYYPQYNIYFDNPILNNEGDKEYEPTSIFFSDELFNGKECNFTIKVSGGKIETPYHFYVMLRTTSYNYYKYRKLWTRHKHNQNEGIDFYQDLFRGEPIDMFTNVNGGYGIVAGYSEDCKEAVIIPVK